MTGSVQIYARSDTVVCACVDMLLAGAAEVKSSAVAVHGLENKALSDEIVDTTMFCAARELTWHNGQGVWRITRDGAPLDVKNTGYTGLFDTLQERLGGASWDEVVYWTPIDGAAPSAIDEKN